MSSQPKTPYDIDLALIRSGRPLSPAKLEAHRDLSEKRLGYLQALRDQAAAQDMLRIVRMVAGLPDDAARRNGCSALVEDARAILSTLAKVGA